MNGYNTQNTYKAQPEKLPEPTYWPIFLALGVVCLFWGILTNWFVSGIGLVIFGVALSGWITDIYHELNENQNDEL